MTNLEKINTYKKSALVIYARKNSVVIQSRFTKSQVISAIISAKKNGTFKSRGF